MAGPTSLIRENCPLSTPSNDGLMSAADKAKLDSLTPVGAGVTSVAAGTGIECTPDPIIATGTVALADTSVTPGSYTNTNLTIDQQGRITAAANGGAVLPVIPNYLTVAPSGDVDYNTIGDAVAAAIAMGAGAGNEFIIQVYPGFYFENPINLQFGVKVEAMGFDVISTSVIIFAADPNNDLITFVGGGSISGVMMFGVSDPLKALGRISEVNAISGSCVGSVNSSILTGCSNGVIVESTANLNDVVLVSDSMLITSIGPGFEIGNGLVFRGSRVNSIVGMLEIATTGLGGYSVNPIQTAISVDNAAQVGLTTMLCKIEHLDSTAVALSVNNGGLVVLKNPSFTDCATALLVGAGGSDSFVNIFGGFFQGNTVNFDIESATGIVFATVVTDMKKAQLVPGAVLSGIIQELDALATDLVGSSAVAYDSERQASLPDFVHSLQKSGVRAGGAVTDPSGLGNAGLDVTVGAGTGWIVRDAPIDVINISWPDTTLTLPASQSSVYIFVDDVTLLPAFSLTVPSASKILLAIVVTDGAIRFIHDAKVLAEDIGTDLQNYLLATQKFVLAMGLAALPGSTVRRFNIDVGAYYRSLELISYPGVNDATFTAFYGTNGANQNVPTQDIDITNYDNGGVLTPMSAGFFRADSVYITSDGQVSVIYADAQYMLQTDAANEQIAPPMSFISESAFSICTLIVQQGNGIVQIVDQRVVTAKAGAAAITVHGQLSGLSADDHPQYFLASGSRPMGGNLNLGGNQIVSVLDVNGVVVENHHVRHQPGGIDAIPTNTPVSPLIGTANSEGTANTLARSDHQHGMTSGTPRTIGTANVEGSSSSPARLDHVHSHGVQTDGSLHALAIASGAAGFLSGADKAKLDGLTPGAAVASVSGTAPIVSSGGTTPTISITNATELADGSMSAADKTKLDGVTSGATNTPLASTTPASVSAAAGAVGVGTTAARADHVHQVSVGTSAATVGTANAGGSSNNLSRADHIHAHGAQTDGTLHAAATGSVAGFLSAADKTKLDGLPTSAVPTSRTLTAGSGLTGGGDLSADRTFNVGANADGSITVNPTDIQVGVLATDAQHGNRGGGTLHANATGSVAGFMSAADKTKLDGITSQVTNVTGTAPITSTGGTTPAIGITAATTSAAGSMSAADKSKLDGLANAQQATSTSAIAGFGSVTDTLMTGMTITPGAGTWMVDFNTDISDTNINQSVTVSIYVNGVQIAASERTVQPATVGARKYIGTIGLAVGVLAGQAIEIRWRVSGATATANNRTLIVLKVQ